MYRKIILTALIFMIMFSIQSISGTDYSKVGVQNGDTFKFILDEYESTSGGKTDNEFYLGYDDQNDLSHYITAGTEFTLTIIDANPNIETYYEDDYSSATIVVEYSYGENTFQDEEYLDGNLISTTDWDGIRAELENVTNEFEELFGENSTVNFEIIDSSNEFGYVVNYQIHYEDPEYGLNFQVTANGEIRFDKKTGILNLMDISIANTEIEAGKTDSYSENMKLRRLGVDNNDLSIPGFEFVFTFMGLGIFVFIQKRNKSS